MQIIKTVSFPDERLLSDVGPLPAGLRGIVWNLRDRPQDAEYADIDAVILPYVDAYNVLDSLSLVPGLKLVQTQTTGYDGVAEAAGSAAVATAAGVHAAATAELAVGLILAKLRGMDCAARDQTAHRWRPVRGTSLADRRVLLVGTGGIGQEIARRLEPFEVTLTRVARTAREDHFGKVHGTLELGQLAASHDVLVVITPLSDDTDHLINAEVLASLPDNALVVNVGRGAVIDSAALTNEVISGRLQCALDVFDPEPLPADHPLWDSPGALITPHLGGNTTAFEPRITKLIGKQLAALASGQTPANLVRNGPF
jgi:phosphoglycerate dehydrogenase-like enzyme